MLIVTMLKNTFWRTVGPFSSYPGLRDQWQYISGQTQSIGNGHPECGDPLRNHLGQPLEEQKHQTGMLPRRT